MTKRIFGLILLVTSILFITACSSETVTNEQESQSSESSEPSERLEIYTTVYPMQYFAEQIAGDQAEVKTILPAGSDPHTYEPTTKELIEMAEGDAFIYNGASLEPYAEQITDSIKSEDVAILEASKGLDLKEHQHGHGEESESGHDEEAESNEKDTHEGENAHEGHNEGGQDPHVWLDPVLSIQVAENIKDTLVELNPEHEDVFEENFEQLQANLEELDQTFHDTLESTPKNKIIVSHAAYGYWEQAYGVEQLAISGLSPTNEPSQKELQELIEAAEEYDLNHVFFEQNVTPKVSEVVRKEIGAETMRIHNLSVLTDEDIEKGEDYFSLMEHNLEQLNKALSN